MDEIDSTLVIVSVKDDCKIFVSSLSVIVSNILLNSLDQVIEGRGKPVAVQESISLAGLIM